MRRLLTLLFCLLPTLASALEPVEYIKLETSEGDIVLELDLAKAPISCENFINYVKKGHFDGTVFHRVIGNFMIQGGGFAIEDSGLVQKPTDPPIQNEGQNGLKNLRGTIAMARTNELHSATSQFFINVVDNPNLDFPSYGGYAVFGKVYEGMDVVDKIRNVSTGLQNLTSRLPNGTMSTRPAPNVPREPVIIKSATVINPSPPIHTPAPKPSPDSTETSKPSEEDIAPIQKWHGASAWSLFSSWFILALAFLLGSIPFGLLMAKSQGINIREHGSGNIGATNVWRTLGKKFGIPCLLLDALKGFIPVALAINLYQIGGRDLMVNLSLPETWIATFDPAKATSVQVLHILTALLAVLGHNYSPWVGFKGGKGIATSAGVLIALIPVATLILLAIWLILFFTTRYVSVASILASCSLPLIVIWGSWHHKRLQDGTWNKPLFVFALVIAVMATWKHRSNIKRLMEGTEARFSRKSKTSSDSTSDDHE